MYILIYTYHPFTTISQVTSSLLGADFLKKASFGFNDPSPLSLRKRILVPASSVNLSEFSISGVSRKLPNRRNPIAVKHAAK